MGRCRIAGHFSLPRKSNIHERRQWRGVPVAREPMPTDVTSTLIFLARLLMGGAFAFAGLRNMTNVPVLTGMMAARGVPQAKVVLLAGSILQVVCGALLIVGLWTAIAAVGLIGFLLVATWMFHNFWDRQGPERAAGINGIVSNVALLGGFLLVIATAL
jgi:putative oxidoreductase